MALTSGYYMPQAPYYNQQQYTMPSYVPQTQPYTTPMYSQQSLQGVIWVDGEVAAKAMQIPVGWDTSKSIAFWDMNEPVIYIRSFNQMGMPNPLQKIHYVIDGQKTLPNENTSGDAKQEPVNTGNFVTRDDMEGLKSEIAELKEMLKQQHHTNQNTNQNGQSRGGNR